MSKPTLRVTDPETGFLVVNRMPTLRGRIALKVMTLTARWGFPGRHVRFEHRPKP